MQKLPLIALSAYLLILVSCERDSSFEGPDFNDIYGDFALLKKFEVSAGEVDFATGQIVYFLAEFSKMTKWTLTISHTSTGATKKLEGFSKELNLQNATWDGSTSQFPSFSPGICIATLFTEADSGYRSLEVKVLSSKVPKGTVVADFENGLKPGWRMFVQSGANMSFVINDSGIVPQGNKYFHMGGEVSWDWLIGLIDFPSTSMGSNGFDLGNNPNDLYFNVILNRPPQLPNGFVLFQFKEDENEDGIFNESNEDMYALEIRDLKPGWQVVSVKYSDLVSLVNGEPRPPRGNNVHNPDKLHTISCLFLANPNSGFALTKMDYIIFTKGSPLKL
jgi:hypothetical protein